VDIKTFADTTGMSRNLILKDNGQKKKDKMTSNDQQNTTQKTKDWAKTGAPDGQVIPTVLV